MLRRCCLCVSWCFVIFSPPYFARNSKFRKAYYMRGVDILETWVFFCVLDSLFLLFSCVALVSILADKKLGRALLGQVTGFTRPGLSSLLSHPLRFIFLFCSRFLRRFLSRFLGGKLMFYFDVTQIYLREIWLLFLLFCFAVVGLLYVATIARHTPPGRGGKGGVLTRFALFFLDALPTS